MSHYRICWDPILKEGDDMIRDGAMPPVGASAVWAWPETRAFLCRLGVSMNQPITGLEIRMDFGSDKCEMEVKAVAADHTTWVKDLLNVEDAP